MANMGSYLIAAMKTSPLKPAVRIQNDHWKILYKTNKILQKHGRQGGLASFQRNFKHLPPETSCQIQIIFGRNVL